jgi:hypothetical protein
VKYIENNKIGRNFMTRMYRVWNSSSLQTVSKRIKTTALFVSSFYPQVSVHEVENSWCHFSFSYLFLFIHFDLSSAFDLVSHIILLHKLCVHGLSDGYVFWFCSYLSNQQSSECISVPFSLPFKVFSGVPRECFRTFVF